MSLPVVLLALQVAAAPVPALSWAEQSYLDARNAANDRVSIGGMKTHDEEKRVIAELTARLRGIIGPIPLAGIDGLGRAAYEGFEGGFEGPGSTDRADGLVFNWRGSVLFVTTRALFARAAAAYLPSPDLTVDEYLFCNTVFQEAPLYLMFAEIPVRHGSSTELARASVGTATEDFGPWPPNTLVVQVVRGDRVYMVGTRLNPGFEQVPNCEAKWNPRGEQVPYDMERVSFNAYRRCVGAVITPSPLFAAVVRRAQAIVDALEGNEPPQLPAGRPAGEPK
jgi:hypothetical protein